MWTRDLPILTASILDFKMAVIKISKELQSFQILANYSLLNNLFETIGVIVSSQWLLTGTPLSIVHLYALLTGR